MSKNYIPVFAEEIFIVNLYGTDEEIDEFNELIKQKEAEKNLVSIALLIEEIKRRNFLKMDWQCCDRCRYYKNCKINWYRGERDCKTRHCCTYCQNYWTCYKEFCSQNNMKSEEAPHFAEPEKKADPDNTFLLSILIAILILFPSIAEAGLSLSGATGYITVPSHEVSQRFDLAVSTRMHTTKSGSDEFLTNLALTFSPFENFEAGIQAPIDSAKDSTQIDPVLHFKASMKGLLPGDFSRLAFGGIFDTNPNNWHSLYLTAAGFGVAYNFGGEKYSGTSHFGKYKNNRPNSVSIIAGAQGDNALPGETGYRTAWMLDYNGDVVSLGWRLFADRGFSLHIAFQTQTSYDDFYDFKPVLFGFGANF